MTDHLDLGSARLLVRLSGFGHHLGSARAESRLIRIEVDQEPSGLYLAELLRIGRGRQQRSEKKADEKLPHPRFLP